MNTSVMNRLGWVGLLVGALLWSACGRNGQEQAVVVSGVPVQSYEVIRSYPHDRRAFTQGLQFHDGQLYESTGQHGASSLRRVELKTGRVLQRVNLPDRYFGEGIAIVTNRIHMLTWRAGVGFIFDLDTLRRVGQFTYAGEGWGLAYDGEHLIMSDGSHRLRFLSPDTFDVMRVVDVTADGAPVERLNELAWIEGEIWANVWKTDRIARIDPESGRVRAWIDLTGILRPEYVTGPVDVLNGIAYDEETGRIFVTGKLWPRLFEIRVVD